MRSTVARNELLCAALAWVSLLAFGVGGASAGNRGDGTGGAMFVPPPPPIEKAQLRRGRAVAPRGAPERVRRVIEAANRLVDRRP